MKTYADKSRGSKSQSVVNDLSQTQSSQKSTFQFVDNRPESVAQIKRQEMADNSSPVSQLRAFQNMANNSPQAQQTAQLQAMTDNHSMRQQHPIQNKENNTGLPDNLKSGIENLSGYSMDDVKVHYSSDKPAQLQAHAYTQGTDIHLASGQEKHLPHETWHVVQQKQGRVNPTMQMKGVVNINDDAGLEREADVMGEKARAAGNDKGVNQLKPQPSTNVIQGRFLKLGYWDDEPNSVSITYLKQNKENNGLAKLTDAEWDQVETLVESNSMEEIFSMNEEGLFDINEVRQKSLILHMAKKFAGYIDNGDLVAFGDKHGSFVDFDFPRLIAKVATKKSTLLLEAPDISLKDMEEKWGKTSMDTANIAKLGSTIASEENWSVKGVDALHPSGSGYVTGKRKYLDEEEQEIDYGKKETQTPYPEKALGPGRRIGPIRQIYIAKQLKKAMAKGGCLLVIGSVHIKGKTGTDTITEDNKKVRKNYRTKSLHKLLTDKDGKLYKVKMPKGVYTVQVIKKSLIK